MPRKVVYIAHPVSGNVQSNLAKVLKIIEIIGKYDTRVAPIAPYRDYCLALDNASEEERRIGQEMDDAILLKCDEMWMFGPRISDGMKHEKELAEQHNIPVIDYTHENKFAFIRYLNEVASDHTNLVAADPSRN